MPGVTPAMWDWWLAWHISNSPRSKLWHPRAHVHAVWGDNRPDLPHYLGRTSHIVEYIGASKFIGAISYMPPGCRASRLMPPTSGRSSVPAAEGSVLVGALKKHGLFFPAGPCKDVCLGGYLLQGGVGSRAGALRCGRAVSSQTPRLPAVHRQHHPCLHRVTPGGGLPLGRRCRGIGPEHCRVSHDHEPQGARHW